MILTNKNKNRAIDIFNSPVLFVTQESLPGFNGTCTAYFFRH
jgi:hypothetical protein